MPDSFDSLDFKTGPLGIKLSGPNALLIGIFVVNIAVAALFVWEHDKRSAEHEQIQCALKLNLYVQGLPKGAVIQWDKMPVDLYSCIPPFLWKRGE